MGPGASAQLRTRPGRRRGNGHSLLTTPDQQARMRAMRKLPVVLTCRRPCALPRRANQPHISGCPVPDYEGRFAIVTNVGCGMRWPRFHQALLRKTTDEAADG